MNLFDRLSGSRLYEELLLSFNETEPVRTLKKLSDFGLLKVIYPTLYSMRSLRQYSNQCMIPLHGLICSFSKKRLTGGFYI